MYKDTQMELAEIFFEKICVTFFDSPWITIQIGVLHADIDFRNVDTDASLNWAKIVNVFNSSACGNSVSTLLKSTTTNTESIPTNKDLEFKHVPVNADTFLHRNSAQLCCMIPFPFTISIDRYLVSE